MITKNNNDYSFSVNGTSGKLNITPEYSLEYQDNIINFQNLKELHIFINVLTDIVVAIDDNILRS